MPRVSFEHELESLQSRILAMGNSVECMLLESVSTLKKRNLGASRRLIDQDILVNAERYRIEADTLRLIATQAPMAGDLRTLAAVLEIAGELERIGDYAKGITNISLMIGSESFIKPLVDIPAMAKKAVDMLQRALAAFVNRDIAVASAIPQEDDVVDALYNQVYRELITYVIADPKVIEQINLLLWAAHNLERAADRVTNIYERVIFTVTGQLIDVGSEHEGLESF